MNKSYKIYLDRGVLHPGHPPIIAHGVMAVSTKELKAGTILSLSNGEYSPCGSSGNPAGILLEDVAVLIDALNANASADAKKVVSCNAVIRAIGNGDSDIPIGATQGSMSALGYSQSWTVGSGGSTSEIYLSRTDKKLLGAGRSIGSYSPIEELV